MVGGAAGCPRHAVPRRHEVRPPRTREAPRHPRQRGVAAGAGVVLHLAPLGGGPPALRDAPPRPGSRPTGRRPRPGRPPPAVSGGLRPHLESAPGATACKRQRPRPVPKHPAVLHKANNGRHASLSEATTSARPARMARRNPTTGSPTSAGRSPAPLAPRPNPPPNAHLGRGQALPVAHRDARPRSALTSAAWLGRAKKASVPAVSSPAALGRATAAVEQPWEPAHEAAGSPARRATTVALGSPAGVQATAAVS